MPNFKTIFFKDDQECLLGYFQRPTSLLDFRFRTRIWTIMRTDHRERDRICRVCCPIGSFHLWIESTSESTLTSQKRRRIDSLLLIFQRRYDIISNSDVVPIFSFSWRYWFLYYTQIGQSIAIPLVHYLGIFFWRETTITLNNTTGSSFVSSKKCISESVVGAPSGRHSRLSPASSTLHSLNDIILLPRE